MLNIKRGIAISLYDKFDELAILHDIFKENFKENYYLYVCSNHPNAEEEIKKRSLDFDGYIQGEDIYFSNQLSSKEKRLSLVCRSTDTVKKSCSLAIDNDCDYVMHIHCDAWPLNEKKLSEHFNMLENSDYSIAVRGLGWSYYGHDRPLGGIDDHFFIFNTSKIIKNNIFDFDVLEMLPHMLSVHGILGAQIIMKIGLKNCLYYDDLSDHVCWKDEKKILPFLPVKPSLYDEKRRFIHIHRESFPDDLGYKLQSFYLFKNSLLNGIHIQKHIQLYEYDHELPLYLSRRLKKGIKKLKLYGYKSNIYAQEIKRIEDIITKTTIQTMAKNYTKKLIYFIISKFKRTENIWPIPLDNYYDIIIDKSYFPARKRYWFKGHE